MTELTVSEVLSRAADLIEPEGAWCQLRYGTTLSGPRCATGAIMAVTAPAEFGYLGAKEAANRFVGMDLTFWNDAPERTQAEVVAALREAAKRAA